MNDWNNGLNTFQYVAAILATPLRIFHTYNHSLRTQSLERIEIYLEDYKLQINNSLAGIG